MRLGNEVLGITGGGFRLALLDDSKPQRPCQWYVSHHHVNNLLQSVVRHHHENNLLQNLRWSRRNLGRRGFSSDQVLLVLLTYARLREHLLFVVQPHSVSAFCANKMRFVVQPHSAKGDRACLKISA
jgi:hypothetical protein